MKLQQQRAFPTFNYISTREAKYAAVPKPVANARERNYQLWDDGFQLLNDIPVPDKRDYANEKDFFAKLRDLALPLAESLTATRGKVENAHFYLLPPLMRSDKEGQQHAGKQSNEIVDTATDPTMPHDIVHNDYSFGFKTYLQSLDKKRLQKYMYAPASQMDLVYAQVQGAKRIIVLQFWASAQSNGTLLDRHPLAFCVPKSIASDHRRAALPMPLPQYGDFDLGDYKVSLADADYAAQHEWVYYPRMTRNEMLVWCGYDSQRSKPFLHGFHSAFDNSDWCLPETPPRESVEMRVVCILPEIGDVDFFTAAAAVAAAATARL